MKKESVLRGGEKEKALGGNREQEEMKIPM